MRFRVAQPWCAAAARAPSLAPTFSSPRSLWASILRRSEEHTSELQSQSNLVCRLLLEKKKQHLADHHFRLHEDLRETVPNPKLPWAMCPACPAIERVLSPLHR